MSAVVVSDPAQESIHRLPGIVACEAEGVEAVEGDGRFGGDEAATGKETQGELFEDWVDGIHGDGLTRREGSVLGVIAPVVTAGADGDGVQGDQGVVVDSIAELAGEVEEGRRRVFG